MATNAVDAAAGIGWLKSAVNLGRSNPKAIFGGAALFLLAGGAVMMAVAMLQGVIVAAMGGGMAAMLVGMLILVVAAAVMMSALMIGYLRLIDAVENDRPVRAVDVFGGFGDTATMLRTIGFVLLLGLAQYVLMGVLLAVFAGDVLEWYVQVLQASTAGAEPPAATSLPNGFGLGFTLIQLLGLVFYAVQAIGLGQVVLRRRRVLAALGDGFAGAFKNLLPLLALALVLVLAMVVVGVVLVLLVALAALLVKMAGAWATVVAVVVAVPLYLLLLLVMLVVMFGLMYYLWRDICGAPVAGDALSA